MQIGTATGLRSQVFGSSSLPWGTIIFEIISSSVFKNNCLGGGNW